MSDAKGQIQRLKLVGGALCLDFANTTGWRPDPGDEEYLRDYEDVVVWAALAGAASETEARRLLRRAKSDPERARAVHARAVALREALYRILSASAAGHLAGSRDIDAVNQVVHDAYRHLCIAPHDGGFAWEWDGARDALELPLWKVARSAADLLVSSELRRVRECSGHRCDWLFLDASRNRSRRWCDMANCGNRAKARRNYERRREITARVGEARGA
ncbi:MAG: ABATE domain-containing protein [Candidatus Bipolaricaulis sp.]|nr:ABATE domain-containing protein [Candidatus Bipolaricaulis sp.]